MSSKDLFSAHPNLKLHLTDVTTFPILSSAKNSNETASLTTLTTTFTNAHVSIRRLGLGELNRITVRKKDGGGIVQSYIDVPPTESSSVELEEVEEGTDEAEVEPQNIPAMVATAVASRNQRMAEARTAVKKLELLGRGVQDEWIKEHKPLEQEVEDTQENGA